METVPHSYSSLYRRIRLSRNVIPLTMCTGVLAFETFEHGSMRFSGTPVIDVVVFGVIGPLVTFLVLNWLLHRVKERDEAETRLAVVTARERELLARLDQSVRAESFGIMPTLENILAAVGVESSLTGAALYLLSQSGVSLLPASVAWPSPEMGRMLADVARKSLTNGNGTDRGTDGGGQMGELTPEQRVLTVPITDRGETLGFLVLTGPADCDPPDSRILGVVAGSMALLIRNNQLYARLESQAVIEERNELAREVHDGLAQSLGFLSVKTQQVKRLLERGDVSATMTAVDELSDGSREAYEEVRVLIRSLRASAGLTGGLVASIRSYSALLAKRTGLEITVEADSDPSVAPEVQLQLFRVVQEALTNAHRHARARHVRVRLEEELDCISLTVEDDGLGLSAAGLEVDGEGREDDGLSIPETLGSHEHLGIQIMRERLQSIGAQLQIESRPGSGTTVRIRVPAGCDDASGAEIGQGAA